MQKCLWPIIYPVCILLFAALGFFAAGFAQEDTPTHPEPLTYYDLGDTVTAVPFDALVPSSMEPSAAPSAEELPIHEDSHAAADPLLLLVNSWNPLPQGYIDSVTLVNVGDGFLLDNRAAEDFTAMMDAMRADGLYPTVNSAYRDHETQTRLYENKAADYESEGHSQEEAEALAAQWVAVPGTSEHEAGLAVDISMYEADCDEIHLWLRENGWRYGFIYRYPEGSTEETGIQPEPWHYRYVGRDNAESIFLSGLTLEGYLSSISR